ncbi:hypothetical protein G5C66_00910 [Nocardioides sp. KC13]|uniref:Uncharacterized protein n=1 Tax=Nocardioides turkmenicus TaxID=2711220 RepID=A0A6M1R0R4_9ACTN|nr:hypothetical protein [Nocardioides sp. KC13]NGN91298.1 hypothetical protein [Nocardioides sp. KC13]
MPTTLGRAFPSGLRASLSEALVAMPRPLHAPSGDITSSYSRKWPEITVGGEPVEIPYRVYNPVPSNRVAPEGSQATVAVDCLYTRHHDGFVRQQALRRVLRFEQAWIIPFVVQLLGEYVIEICEDIHGFVVRDLPRRPAMVRGLRSFVTENSDFFTLTELRATSYWACYYRSTHLYRDTYPAMLALKAMRDLAA